MSYCNNVELLMEFISNFLRDVGLEELFTY
jgi:hypothetical protein